MAEEIREYDKYGRKTRVKTAEGREYIYTYDYYGRYTCDEVGGFVPFANGTPAQVPKVDYGIRRPEIVRQKGWREW
jgi:YD repeat-containing protein